MTAKQRRMYNAYNNTGDDVLLVILGIVVGFFILLYIVYAIVMGIHGKTTATIKNVNIEECELTKKHREGAYTRTYKVAGKHYTITLQTDKGEVVVQHYYTKDYDEYDSNWAKETFQVGNTIKYNDWEGFMVIGNVQLVKE